MQNKIKKYKILKNKEVKMSLCNKKGGKKMSINLKKQYTSEDLIELSNSLNEFESWERYQAYKQHCLRIIKKAINALEKKDYDTCLEMTEYESELGIEVLNFDDLIALNAGYVSPLESSLKAMIFHLKEAEEKYGVGCLNLPEVQKKSFAPKNNKDKRVYAISVLSYIYEKMLHNDLGAILETLTSDGLINFSHKKNNEISFYELVLELGGNND